MRDKTLIFIEPWESSDEQGFLKQLNKEITKEHILYGIKLKVVARRIDTDDVLFQLVDKPDKFAQVHLTWKNKSEGGSDWPRARLFNSFNNWKEEIMIDDNKYY